jgi:hypothetical protein
MTDSKLTASEALAAADIAREAARLVARPGGWCQGRATNSAGGFCAGWAMWEASGGTAGRWSNASNEFRREVIARVGPAIPVWNDAPERKQSDVVELFESITKHFDREASKVER